MKAKTLEERETLAREIRLELLEQAKALVLRAPVDKRRALFDLLDANGTLTLAMREEARDRVEDDMIADLLRGDADEE